MVQFVRGAAFAAAIVVASGLGGCQTTRVVQPLPAADFARIGIGNVSVEYKMDDRSMQSNMSSEFKQDLELQIGHAAKHCGGGELTRDVRVSINFYRRANAALTVLLGDSNQLHGTVYFVDPAGAPGTTVGTYDVTVAEGGGGLLGVAIMANGDSWMAREFAARICSQVLKRKAPRQPAVAQTAPAQAAPVQAVSAPAAQAPAAAVQAVPAQPAPAQAATEPVAAAKPADAEKKPN